MNCTQKTGVVKDFEEFIEDLRHFDGDLVLYGAGLYGEISLRILQRAGYCITAFCDGNPAKTGTLYHGIPVISIAQLCGMDHAMVLVTVAQQSQEGACRGLISAGIPLLYAVLLPEYRFSEMVRSPEDVKFELDTANEMQAVFNRLADDSSRAVFIVWMYGQLTGESMECGELPRAKCPVDTELCIEGEKLDLFQRQARSSKKIILIWHNCQPGLLTCLAKLMEYGYTKLWLCHQGDIMQIGGEKA